MKNEEKERPIVQWKPYPESHPFVFYDYSDDDYDENENTYTELWTSSKVLVCLIDGDIQTGEYIEARTYDMSSSSRPVLIKTDCSWSVADLNIRRPQAYAWATLPLPPCKLA